MPRDIITLFLFMKCSVLAVSLCNCFLLYTLCVLGCFISMKLLLIKKKKKKSKWKGFGLEVSKVVEPQNYAVTGQYSSRDNPKVVVINCQVEHDG